MNLLTIANCNLIVNMDFFCFCISGFNFFFYLGEKVNLNVVEKKFLKVVHVLFYFFGS